MIAPPLGRKLIAPSWIGRLHRRIIELDWNVKPNFQLITQDLAPVWPPAAGKAGA
jgi:hypothetical protein